MKLLVISSFVAVSGICQALIESGIRYDISGWDSKCQKIPEGCINGASDVVELNNCLIDNNDTCHTKRIQVAINEPEFTLASNQGIWTIFMKIKKPLFPGGWILRNGKIRTPVESIFPTDVGVVLEGSTMVFKEGPVTDLSGEDLSKWTPLGCTFGPDLRAEIAYVTHTFTCSDKAHELLKHVKEVHFAMLKDRSIPVMYNLNALPATAEIILSRTTKANSIPQVMSDDDQDSVYSATWLGSGCKDIPESCHGMGLKNKVLRKCIETHRKTDCQVHIWAHIYQSEMVPLELQINGVDTLVEGIFIDPAKVFFTDVNPPLHWRQGDVGYQFPMVPKSFANIYVSRNLGDFSGKLDQALNTIVVPPGTTPVQIFKKPGLNLSQTGGWFIYLDRKISSDIYPTFMGIFQLNETSITNSK